MCGFDGRSWEAGTPTYLGAPWYGKSHQGRRRKKVSRNRYSVLLSPGRAIPSNSPRLQPWEAHGFSRGNSSPTPREPWKGRHDFHQALSGHLIHSQE
jgi:hypothetical protein